MVGIGLTGNAGFDFFIMQSEENLHKVFHYFSNSGERYINNILIDLKLNRKDFTDSDWKVIKQYLWEDDING